MKRKNRYEDESIQDIIEASEKELKVIKSLGSRPGLTGREADEAFEVDEMLDHEPDAHSVLLADMQEDTSSGFDPDEEYEVDVEEEIEFLDGHGDE